MIWKLRCKIQLITNDDEYIYLRIPRNSSFGLLNTFYQNYNWDSFGPSITAITFVEHENRHDALNIAFREMRNSTSILSFLYGLNIGYNIDWYNSMEQVESMEWSLCLRKSSNLNKLYLSNQALINKYNSRDYNYLIRTIEYYSRALELL